MTTDGNDLNPISAIAIIGMAGRFPQAKNIEEFWQKITTGTECITHYTEEELILAGVDANLVQNPNYIRARGELADIDQFDAGFFGINPKEAELMDPQHRLLLECSWEALENAGYDSERLSGRIGVYAGESMNTYVFLNVYPYIEKVLSSGSLQAAIGNDKDSLTTMIAYKMNLKGPAITIQSSSSTSLTAVCIACQSLLNYQCDLALAGGISVGSPQRSGYLYETRGIVSPDGHCRPFDIKAKGFVPGNGMGMVVLKRLQEAMEDGDSIVGVIRGYAINNDGSAKVSYGAPSVDAQTEVIMEAQAAADVSPETIGYLEAHGTGTEMGDPIEVTALTQAFRAGTSLRHYCALGSVKGNIGHLDTAAGVVGLIKAALALQHKTIPPNINFETPNPKIDLINSPFYISKQLHPWETGVFPRRAGVTSLGMGGTNAHVILEEAPELNTSESTRSWHILLCSAKTENALGKSCLNLADYLEAYPELDLADVAYTLQVGRRHWKYRRVTCCRDRLEAILSLRQNNPESILTSRQARPHQVVFGMTGCPVDAAPDFGLLYCQEPFFAQEVDHCLALFRSQWELFRNGNGIPLKSQNPLADLADYSVDYPWVNFVIWFVIEYGLARLFQKWGICPKLLASDVNGEFCAACLAGVFPVETALLLVAIHAQISQHSADMSGNELHARFQQALERHQLKSPLIPVLPTLTGKQVLEQDVVSCAYWVAKLTAMNDSDCHWPETDFKDTIFIELGPGKNLNRLALNPNVELPLFIPLLPQAGSKAIPEQLLKALGQLWLDGIQVDWEAFSALEHRRRIPLPTYPFERQSYWLQPRNTLPGNAAVVTKLKEAVQIKGKTSSELTACEKMIAEAWSEVLGFTEFSPEDNFFEIGGDSILLIKLHSLLDAYYPGRITATDLFAYPTITKLAQYLGNMGVPTQGADLPKVTRPDEKEQIQRLLEEGKKGNLSIAEILKKLNTLEE